MLRRIAAAALLPMLMSAPVGVPAAHAESTAPAWWWGFGGGGFSPQGAFAGHAEFNGTLELFVAHQVRDDSPWGVRLTGQAVEFARNDTTYALPGIDVRTRSSSQLLWLTLGPQLELGDGPVRVLLNAGVGGAWAVTKTAVRTSTNDVGSTHLQRAALAFEAGGGLSYELTRARNLRLELGGRWLHTGSLEYVPESGIRREAGRLVLSPRRDALDGITVRAALALGLGNGMR
jgi:hypothetical protein